MRKINRLVLGISIILLILTFSFSIQLRDLKNKNKGYTLALQGYLGTTMETMIDRTHNNAKILENSIDKKTISKHDANVLGEGFLSVSQASQDLYNMLVSISVNKNHSKLNNWTATTSHEFSLYISQLILKQPTDTFFLVDNPELVALSDENITKFKKMKEVTDNWSKVVNQNVPKHTIPNDVAGSAWKNVVTGLSDYANKLQWRANQIFE